jgi:Putative 8-oxoguanine DNA glycosylase OGG-like protein
MLLDQTHLEKFRTCFQAEPTQKPVGKNPFSYDNQIDLPQKYRNKILNRKEIRKLCREHKVKPLTAFTCVMAWGGQWKKHYKNAIANKSLPKIIKLLRQGLPRKEAFDLLNNLYLSKKLPGLGIAFFTKLIYFFSPKQDGFILDQWTAKSAALLCDYTPIKLEKSYGGPDKKTTGAEYENFCRFIEYLTKKRNWKSPDATEIALFGKIDRRKTDWRKYVEEHFPKIKKHRICI